MLAPIAVMCPCFAKLARMRCSFVASSDTYCPSLKAASAIRALQIAKWRIDRNDGSQLLIPPVALFNSRACPFHPKDTEPPVGPFGLATGAV
jgi:hypothetical protein